jgi:hypothetical protein
MNQHNPVRTGASGRDDRRASYDVRFWKIRVYQGKRKTTYSVRWTVSEQEFHQTFGTKAHAESRLAELRTAARKGEAFDVQTGLPVSELELTNARTWYEHVNHYVEKRWLKIGGGQRRSIADAIATATAALLTTDRGQPDPKLLRRTVYAWTCNMTRRDTLQPPDAVASAMAWLEANTMQVSALADQTLLDAVLERMAARLDGKSAAANTIARRRSVLSSVLGLAVDEGLLDANPLARSRWTAPDAVHTVDPDVVINHQQAQALLTAVAGQGQMGRHLVAFYGCMYYAALRPSETVALNRQALRLSAAGWGEFRLRESAPLSGSKWSDNGKSRDQRQLKHRAKGDVRVVPIPPPLTEILNSHLTEFGAPPRRAAVPRPSGRAAGRQDVRRYLAGGAPGRPDAGRGSISARATALRPAARRSVHLAQRRSGSNAGRRVGRPQRPSAPAGLRQVHRGPGRDRSAADRDRARRGSHPDIPIAFPDRSRGRPGPPIKAPNFSAYSP